MSQEASVLAAKKRNINNQLILKQTNEMTSKLNDISRQLKWTENQTSDIIPVLDQSSKTIQNAQQEFTLMKTVITDGRRLLTRLGRREFTDKLLIILCLCFFFSVVFYIVWKRLFRF
jgi:protein transport protein SEC20